MLPQVISLLEQLQASRTQLANLETDLTRLHWRGRRNGKEPPDDTFTSLQERRDSALQIVNQQVNALRDLGCVIKDLDTGLIDFLSVHEGRPVYLCWRLGESTISFWHDLNVGFAGRQALEPGK